MVNRTLAQVLEAAGFGLGDPANVEHRVTTSDGIHINRRPDGRTYVTLPTVEHALCADGVQPITPSDATLKRLECSASKPWAGHRTVLVLGAKADACAAGLGYTIRKWGNAHAPVRWVSAMDFPSSYGKEQDAEAVMSIPQCETLIIGQLWGSLSRPQVDFALKVVMSRRARNTILAVDPPTTINDSWGRLIGHMQRCGPVLDLRHKPA